MPKYTAMINERGHEDIRVDIDFEYEEDDGCFPNGYRYFVPNPVLTAVNSVYLVHECLHALTKEDIPKIKGICEIEDWDDHFTYSHKREISDDSWLCEMACTQAIDRFEWVAEKYEDPEELREMYHPYEDSLIVCK